ncbi:hypothetical protein FRB90_011522 [Tulasnella sp. 427]|nr:hypothetical protein FRB90_011522 [Tulasnella sp. 427]
MANTQQSHQEPLSSFTTLSQSLRGEIVRPGEPDYEYGISRWTDNSVRHASYVVFPRCSEDVAKAILFAKSRRLEVAVCGGGHSWSSASSTTGLVIHLGKYMNGVRCDPKARLLFADGGAVWEAVDRVGMEHGLATVAGTVNHTGVGGLALGGGYGWLTGRRGMAVDNVAELTIVLASGEIVKANEREHSDLFWGCRGGGCNFGAITQFVFKAYPQRPNVFVTILTFPLAKLEQIVEAAEDWYKTAGPDEGCHLRCNGAGAGAEVSIKSDPLYPSPVAVEKSTELVLRVVYFFNGTGEDGRKSANKFYAVGPSAEKAMEELPYVELNGLATGVNPHGGRKYAKGLTMRTQMTPTLMKNLVAAMDEANKSSSNFTNCGVLIDYTPKQAVMSVPLSATAYAGRGTGIEFLAWIYYTDPSLDPVTQGHVRRWCNIVSNEGSIATEAGKGEEGLGIGYANYDPEPKGAAMVFGPNYERLRQVKRKYDPGCVWRKWYPIEPALEGEKQ